MRTSIFIVVTVLAWLTQASVAAHLYGQVAAARLVGDWKVALNVGTPSQPASLPIHLRLAFADDGVRNGLQATFINGPERVSADSISVTDKTLTIDIPHYDSTLILGIDNGTPASGRWRKVRDGGRIHEVLCQVEPWEDISWEDPVGYVGRWSVQFEDEADPAVGEFRLVGERQEVHGTFLTTTGDYRYLWGGVRDGKLQLSRFDGGHAFLFHAKAEAGRLTGGFYSGNWYQTKWTAQRNAGAVLPDGFQLTSWVGRVPLSELRFPTPEGELVALDDPRFSGKCRIIEIFGSWCPNCHDAGAYLSELHARYAEQGLSITGLAFELSGDFERDARQVRRYIDRSQTRYPILIAGTSDKAAATRTLQVLDQVRAYPTMIFLDRTNQVQAIYTGFSGPATGEAHGELRRRFEAIIEGLLRE